MRGTRTPAGVTEMEFRRALASNSQRSLKSASSMDSAALQSEMAKKYNLLGAGQSKPKKRVSKHASTTGMSSTVEAPSSSSVVCACCQVSFNGGEPICPNCGYYSNNLPAVPETLAQRRGLVPVAPKPAVLTLVDWASIENCRADPDSCCPICMEGFKQGHEVLLSCSHIFHRACLRSFENFMKDTELACPICRTTNYQKKITHIGSIAYAKLCAIKIQRLWRGYTTRKQFRVRLRQFYHNLPHSNRPLDDATQARRKMYYQNEFNSITDKLNQHLDSRSDQVNSMLRNMDRTLIESQQLDLLFEQMLAARRPTVGSGDVRSTSTGAGMLQFDAQQELEIGQIDRNILQASALVQDLEYADTSAAYCVEAKQMWKDVYVSAVSRWPCDCAICMLPVESAATAAVTSGAVGYVQSAVSVHNRRDVVLSCAHIFHETCIGNFEKFLCGTKQLTCPVCRSPYSKCLFRIQP